MASTSGGQDTMEDSTSPAPQSAYNWSNEASKTGESTALPGPTAGKGTAIVTDQQPQDNEDEPTDQFQSQFKISRVDSGLKLTETLANINLEIRALQDKLLQLEQQAARQNSVKAEGKHSEEETLDEPGRGFIRLPGIENVDPLAPEPVSGQFRSAEQHSGMPFPISHGSIYSRELGLPPLMKMSNSDEWNNGDNSTGSVLFRGFMSDLRGESNRERFQVDRKWERYKKHEDRKSLAQAKEESTQANEAFEPKPGKKKVEVNTLAKPQLNPVEWDMFRTYQRTHITAPMAIDILIGEPDISDVYWGRLNKYERTQAGMESSLIDPVTHIAYYNPQEPLPERIRINSYQIIETLSAIHRPTQANSLKIFVVMLRPFRMLLYYDKKLRELQSKLLEDLRAAKSTSDKNADAEPPLPNTAATTTTKDGTEDAKSVQDEENSAAEGPRCYSTSEVILEHLKCLIEFMDKYIVEKQAYINGQSYEKILFSDLWHLFKPGDIVIASDGKQAYQVVKITSSRHRGSNPWAAYYQTGRGDKKKPNQEQITVQCVYIHFDGEQLGPVSVWFSIKKYDGWKPVTALPIYPLRFHVLRSMESRTLKSKPDGAELEESIANGMSELQRRLINRGKLFTEVAGVKHMYYSGLTVDTRDKVESQVMIDFEEAFAYKGSWRPQITHFVGAITDDNAGTTPEDNEKCRAPCCMEETVFDDSNIESRRHEDFINSTMARFQDTAHKLPSVAIVARSLEDIGTEENALTEDELLIMSHRVFGFVLRDLTWAELDLTYITEVTGGAETGAVIDDDEVDEEDSSAFGRLILPQGHKKMIISLISQHLRNKTSKYKNEQIDIVRGKGKGLIILLHGAPGVGKTTTAEGIAERFKKPLFHIICGDLGSDAKGVEDTLQTNFALADKWDCILLLDEADVFMAERRREDFTRNGLVAVFLRILEYYNGILFLTTNRIGDFDEALTSRIHVSLYYPPLDASSTLRVLRLNLALIATRYKEKGRSINMDEVNIIYFAMQYFRDNEKARWTGRQIRNACQTALALAEFDAQPTGHKYDLTPVEDNATVHLTDIHLEIVSKAYLDFMEYLEEVYGANANVRAKETGIRALEEVIAAVLSGKSTKSNASGQETGQRRNPLNSFKLNSPSQAPVAMPTASQPAQYYRETPNIPPRTDPHYGESPGAPSQHGAHVGSSMAPGGFPPGDPGHNYAETAPHPPFHPGQHHPNYEQNLSAPPQQGQYEGSFAYSTATSSSQPPPAPQLRVAGDNPQTYAGNIPLQEQDAQGNQWAGGGGRT